MATYTEIATLTNDGQLLKQLDVAIAIAADTIRTESDQTVNHANRLIWAKTALSDPRIEAKKALFALLAANKTATLSNIKTATDVQIQTNVDAIIDVLAGS